MKNKDLKISILVKNILLAGGFSISLIMSVCDSSGGGVESFGASSFVFVATLDLELFVSGLNNNAELSTIELLMISSSSSLSSSVSCTKEVGSSTV